MANAKPLTNLQRFKALSESQQKKHRWNHRPGRSNLLILDDGVPVSYVRLSLVPFYLQNLFMEKFAEGIFGPLPNATTEDPDHFDKF